MTGPMDITVSTPVVVIVWTNLHATNRQVAVPKGVTRDIQMVAVTKVNLQINIYTCYKLICFQFDYSNAPFTNL